MSALLKESTLNDILQFLEPRAFRLLEGPVKCIFMMKKIIKQGWITDFLPLLLIYGPSIHLVIEWPYNPTRIRARSQRFQTQHFPIRADFLTFDFKSALLFLAALSSSRRLVVCWLVGWSVGWLVCW